MNSSCADVLLFASYKWAVSKPSLLTESKVTRSGADFFFGTLSEGKMKHIHHDDRRNAKAIVSLKSKLQNHCNNHCMNTGSVS